MQQQFPVEIEKFIDSILLKSSPAISVVTEIELMCWKASSDEDLLVLQNFIEDSWVFELEKEIKIKTAELRKLHKIKLPDAVIAATSILYDIPLITQNVNDFKIIKTIKLINPYDK